MIKPRSFSLFETIPDYEALDTNGDPYWREARVVGELPHLQIKCALKKLAALLNVKSIPFGIPLYQYLGMTKKEASNHKMAYFLLKNGDQMPLKC